MDAGHEAGWTAAAASTLDWWRQAGVDVLVDEAPRDWLALPPAAPVAPTTPAAPVPGTLPATVADWAGWRHGPHAPEAEWPGDWVAGTAPAGARLLVLADCPDRDDREGLLSGAAGRLFDRMLAAIGLARGDVAVGTLCGKRPLAGRVPADSVEALAALARHHLALAGPERVLLLGNAASRAVLAADTREARGSVHPFAGKDGIGVVATYHPRFLLEKPAAKAAAWADLQLLVKGTDGLKGSEA